MTHQAVAAGGVVFREGAEGVEVILVSRRATGLFALPKGKVDPGEAIEQTALREVREETGLQAEILERLGEVRYWFTDETGDRVDKVVHFFLMRPVGGSLQDHDHEFDDVGWYHLVEAERLLTHKNQLHILSRAAELIAKMPA
ncbi:MAG: NUDIX hydrolase [Dehalococcoidia bacterium]